VSRLRLLVACTLVALGTAAVADVAVAAFSRVDRVSYTPAFHGAAWVSSPQAAPRAWFRLPLALDRRPDAVSIQLDADQTWTLYANGVALGDDKADLAAGFAAVHTMDLTALMVGGDNVIGVTVVNDNRGAAALRAEVTVVQGGRRTELLTGTAHWRATADVAAVETPGLGPAAMTWPGNPGTGGVRLAPGQTIVPGAAGQLGVGAAHKPSSSLLTPGQAAPAAAAQQPLSSALQGALGSLGGNGTTVAGVAGASGVPQAAGQAAPAASATPAPRGSTRASQAQTVTPKLLAQVDAANFSIPGFADPSWAAAPAVQPPRGDVSAAVPAWVTEQPLGAQVVTAPGAPTLLTVMATVTVRDGASDGWLRVGAAGTASLYIDGQLVIPQVGATVPSPDAFGGSGTSGADPWRQSSPPLNVPRQSTGLRAAVPFVSAYHLGPLLHQGSNLLALVVTSGAAPSAYMDGRFTTGGGEVAIGSGAVWTARSTPGSLTEAAATPAQPLGTVNAAWRNRPPVVPIDSAMLNRPDSLLWGPRLLAVALIPGAWVLIAAVARLRGRLRLGTLLGVGAMGMAPALVATEIVGELARLPSFRPPGVLVPPTALALLGASVGGDLLATVLALRSAGLGRLGRRLLALRRRPAALVVRLRRRAAGAAGAFGTVVAHAPVPAPAGAPAGWAVARRAVALGGGGRGWNLSAASGAVAGRLPGLRPLPALSLRSLLARLGGGALWLAHRWSACAVAAVAGGMGLLNAYRLDYQPFWQDELFSLAGARGIRAHGLPIWPSGFQYWKGEIYSVTIAVVGRIFGDTPTALRMVSVVLFAATIAVFGLMLVPEVIGRGRRWLQVGLTVLFATAPAQMTWAREARMYQLADFFMVLFLALFLRALRRPTTRNICFATLALLGMYLSHEETFIALPAVAVVGVLALRSQLWRNRRWIVFGGAAFAVIGAQALLAFKVQPQWFGADHSNRPYVGFDTTDAWYYFSTVFFKGGGGLALVTTLATLGSVVGLVRRNLVRNYLSGFLWLEMLMLSVVFAPRITRYTFIVLPPLFLLAAFGAQDLLDGARRLLTPRGAPPRLARAMQGMATAGLATVVMWLGVSQPVSVQAYGLAVADATSSPAQMQYVDYQYVTDYMKRNWRPGDMWVAAAPPNIAAEYLGRPPDRIIQTHSNDRFFYMFEKNGQAVDTQYGVPVVLAPSDLQRLLEGHHRVWLVTDDTRYLAGLPPGFIGVINQHFAKVAEGASSAVYLGYG
jgi:hypothetical protein